MFFCIPRGSRSDKAFAWRRAVPHPARGSRSAMVDRPLPEHGSVELLPGVEMGAQRGQGLLSTQQACVHA